MASADGIPKLSAKEQLILELLVAHGELYGLDLVRVSGGQLKRGTVYVTLGRMTGKGYVEHVICDPPPGATGPPRRVYHPTSYGQRVYAAWESVWAAFAPGARR